MNRRDQDIVNAMRNNPEQGFRLLMANYKEPVYWHIRRLVVRHDDAQDATQETFVRIFRSVGQYKSSGSFTAWVYRIATNEALRLLASHHTDILSLECEDVAETAIADAYVDYSDLEAVRLQNAILSLPSKQQIAFNLRYYDELTYEEIAEVTDSTTAAVKANYHLAKEKIIAYMNSHN